ncbi:MAG: tetratricopeptide repeat protein [Phycisphaerae bacterium]|nr:tetratricopeptide repeat protein [Tepidisphaeraceae bacterium]
MPMAESDTIQMTSEFDEGLAHLAAERWLEAVACLRKAVRREPGRLAVTRALATAYLSSGDEAAARRVVRTFTAEQPMCAEGWRLAAQLEWKLARRDDALALVARGLDHLPHSPILHRQAALCMGAVGQTAGSAKHAARASSAASRIEPWITAAAGGPGDAGDILQPRSGKPAGPALDPDFFDRLAQDAKSLEGLINLPENGGADVEMLRAIEFRLARLVESQPHHADRQLLLAKLQHRIGAIPAAALSAQRAIRANPNFTQAHRLHATLLAQAGDVAGAIRVLEALVAKGIDWPDLHVQLAELHERQGGEADARSHLYSALRSNPGFGRARDMLERRAA